MAPPQYGENAEAINCSAGSPSFAYSDYPDEARFVDSVVDHWTMPITVSAGNRGSSSKTLVVGAHSYNAIVVGAVDDGNNTDRQDPIYDGSSRGPTYGGRKKPDLVAPGVNINLPNAAGTWLDHTGTSFAAPPVAGAVLLLRQTGLVHPMALKAVLINTADDEIVQGDPPGWDNAYGWGYINLEKAYTHRSDYTISWVSHSTPSRYWKGMMGPGEKATLVWQRHLSYTGPNPPPDPGTLYNLDLYLYKGGSLIDWSTSSVDNVEQVEGPSPWAEVVLEAREVDIPPEVPYEKFALAFPNGSFVEVPSPKLAGGKVLRPERFFLNSNYPNPFNAATAIRFALPIASYVELSVYTLRGQSVRTLAEGRYERGRHQVGWDGKDQGGRDAASGFYFYRLRVTDSGGRMRFQEARKMLLLR